MQDSCCWIIFQQQETFLDVLELVFCFLSILIIKRMCCGCVDDVVVYKPKLEFRVNLCERIAATSVLSSSAMNEFLELLLHLLYFSSVNNSANFGTENLLKLKDL